MEMETGSRGSCTSTSIHLGHAWPVSNFLELYVYDTLSMNPQLLALHLVVIIIRPREAGRSDGACPAWLTGGCSKC